MRQERKDSLKNSEKFEDGLLRVDACFERHYCSRADEYLLPDEDASLSFGYSALWEEKRLLNNVAILISQGLYPGKDQSLEDFVAKYSDRLEVI